MNRLKLLITSILAFSFFAVNAAELHVGDGQTYATVQAAVDAASSGDIITIHEGTYRESVRIPIDGITIQPNGSDKVVMNGTVPLLSWTDEGNGVYSTTMDWNITEGDQTNQIFVDGEMIHLTRWPDQTSDDIVMTPHEATMDGVKEISSVKAQIIDSEFNSENADRWDDATIYINLSNPECNKDGQGWTGKVDIVDGKMYTKAGGNSRYGDCGNWHIGKGTKYYLFNPKPAAVAATGGVGALLSNGEWWKNGNTLYVKTPNGSAPASTESGANLVEAKKYTFAFRPESKGTFSNVTIKGLDLFATSITTLDNYLYSILPSTKASNNIFDNLNVKYVTHSYDCSGDFQKQWNGHSGILLRGNNNVLMNSTIEYSSASGVSIGGKANRLLNCIIRNVNYNVTESGAVNFGQRDYVTVDHQVGYNSIYNTPHAAISMRAINEEAGDVTTGEARIHHNLMYNCLARVYDAGIIDGSRSKNGLRIDHNIMYNSPEFLQIGVYLDYGDFIGNDTIHPGKLIVDHNVIYNVNRCIQVNACSELQIYNNTTHVSDDIQTINIGGVHLEGDGSFIQNNFGIPDDFGYGAITTNNLKTQSYLNTYFTDAANGDYTLTADAVNAINKGIDVSPFNDPYIDTVDIGAYEYGETPWEAGADTNYVTFYKVNFTSVNGSVEPASGMYKAGDKLKLVATGDLGYAFDQWEGDLNSTENPAVITVNSDMDITAKFISADTYTLSVTYANAKGNVIQIPDGSSFNKGDMVYLIGRPANIFQLESWSGDTNAVSDTLALKMKGNTNITANFTELDSFTVQGFAENGTVSFIPSPINGKYIENKKIYVKAVPDENYKFSHWSPNKFLDDSLERQFVVVTEDMSFTAHFEFVSAGNVKKGGNIIIAPNPVNINEGINILNLKGSSSVKVYSLTGQMVFNKTYDQKSIYLPLSDINGITEGIYIIELSNSDNVTRKKFIVK